MRRFCSLICFVLWLLASVALAVSLIGLLLIIFAEGVWEEIGRDLVKGITRD